MKVFVTAIGTDSGKSLVSAILTEALQAVYWKPIQAGEPTDTSFIKKFLPNVQTLPEAYALTQPMSPHAAASFDGVQINLQKLTLPVTESSLVVEGAGGLLVPINDKETIADMVLQLKLPVVLVVNLYLGCINHTLLTLNEIERRGIELKGIVFNGEGFEEARTYIQQYSSAPVILSIPTLASINSEIIQELAKQVCLK